jgi:hypothetical protein
MSFAAQKKPRGRDYICNVKYKKENIASNY